MADEEVIMEVEAVKAVYGDDCTFLSTFPPHLLLQIKPRTADDSSIQFVEASIEVQAGSQYPSDPPVIKIRSSKGLDEKRLKDLSTSLHDKACDLLPYPMLVAICEEAVEKLSIMNHPDGDCPLCLCPLVSEEEQSEASSFMKLMSCFHCFHSECIIRWWKWLQKENSENSSRAPAYRSNAGHQQENMGNCPVCRKVFHSDDIKHVLDLVGSCSVPLVDNDDKEVLDDEKILLTDTEISRRSKFETILQSQKECGGLIEPRTDGVLFASMRLSELVPDIPPEAITDSSRPSDQGVTEAAGPSRPSNQPRKDIKKSRGHKERSTMAEAAGPSRPSNQPRRDIKQPHGHREKSTTIEHESQTSSGRESNQRRDGGTRKYGRKSSRSQVKQWVQKES